VPTFARTGRAEVGTLRESGAAEGDQREGDGGEAQPHRLGAAQFLMRNFSQARIYEKFFQQKGKAGGVGEMPCGKSPRTGPRLSKSNQSALIKQGRSVLYHSGELLGIVNRTSGVP